MPQNFLEHKVGLLKRIVIPKSDHPVPLRSKTGRSLFIARSLLCMLASIEFDDKIFFKADKIDDVRRYGVLPAKFESAEIAVFQMRPKPPFCVGGCLSQSSR